MFFIFELQAYAGENQHVVIFGVVAYNLRPAFPELEDPSDPDIVELCYRYTDPASLPPSLPLLPSLQHVMIFGVVRWHTI